MRPHRWQPTRLLCPWDSPGKNTGVGCHFLLQCMKVKSESEVSQSCPTLSDPMDWSPPGSSIHGIFQARVLEWRTIAFSIYIYIYSYPSWFIVGYWIKFPVPHSRMLLLVHHIYNTLHCMNSKLSILSSNLLHSFQTLDNHKLRILSLFCSPHLESVSILALHLLLERNQFLFTNILLEMCSLMCNWGLYAPNNYLRVFFTKRADSRVHTCSSSARKYWFPIILVLTKNPGCRGN